MMASGLNAFFLAAALTVSVGFAGPEEVNEVVSRARAYLGSEEALEAVRTVHFRGNLTTGDNLKAEIEIIFQKPYRQRIVTTTRERREITALDGYEAWQRYEDLKDPERWRMSLMQKEQVKRLRANTWENLAFSRGIERKGGRIEDLGMAEVGGHAARKLSFVHDTGSVFTRYFDQQTGRLLLTENEQGGTIREEGEIMTGGIRFPKRIITLMKLQDGKQRSVTIEFTAIAINESFADELFVVPPVVPISAKPN